MTEQNSQIKPKLNPEAIQALLELDKKERNINTKQSYYRAYVLSALLPPIGLYYFIKYVGFDEDRKAGLISLIITIISLLFNLWFFSYFFKQIVSFTPAGSNEILKEFITPENQQKWNDLLQ